MPNTMAWATLPPDGAHEPVWGRTHYVDAIGRGAQTLCGKTVPIEVHDWDYGDKDETCLVCRRVLECRKRAETS